MDFVTSSVSHTLNTGYSGGQVCIDVMILSGEEGIEADKLFQVIVSASPTDNIIFGNTRTNIIIHDGIKHCYVDYSFFITSVDNLVFFDQAISTVREDGTAAVCARIQLFNTFSRSLHVVLATINGTGIIIITTLYLRSLLMLFVAQESDLTDEVFSVQTFNNSVNQVCVSISIKDDYILEGNETFLVRLIKFPNESVILGSNTDRTVIIIDDG